MILPLRPVYCNIVFSVDYALDRLGFEPISSFNGSEQTLKRSFPVPLFFCWPILS